MFDWGDLIVSSVRLGIHRINQTKWIKFVVLLKYQFIQISRHLKAKALKISFLLSLEKTANYLNEMLTEQELLAFKILTFLYLYHIDVQLRSSIGCRVYLYIKLDYEKGTETRECILIYSKLV